MLDALESKKIFVRRLTDRDIGDRRSCDECVLQKEITMPDALECRRIFDRRLTDRRIGDRRYSDAPVAECRRRDIRRAQIRRSHSDRRALWWM